MAAVIRPLATRLGFMKRDCAAMLLASLVLLALGALGRITVIEGGVMLLGLAAFIGFSYLTDLRRDSGAQEYIEHELEEMHSIRLSGGMAAGAVILGLVVLVAGSNMLISGATDIARYFGVPEAVIGLSLIAVGTSLPELATSVVAAYRNHADVAIGNVLGSNVFNILGMLGVTSLITAVPISSTMAMIDIPVMLGTAVLLAALLAARWSMGRVLGVAMLAAYAAYLVAMYQGYTAV